jgi:3-oxoacyl-[acyl-carrier protein] reductase
MELNLAGRVVLVTGASGGIGSEVVRKFASENAFVVIHYHKNVRAAEALAAELKPNSFLICQGDLTREVDVARVFAEAEARFGPVEILIANSGICIGYGKPIHQITLEQWNQTIAGNLTSVFLCIREFFKGIAKAKLEDPAAVLIGSTAGKFGEAFNADYAASKSPLNAGFLLSLKNELAHLSRRGRINAICPSWTVTGMVEDLLSDKDHVAKVLQTVTLRKVARPADIASAVLFLSSAVASGHMTGEVLTLAGGMEGRRLYTADEIDLKQV